MLMNLRRSGINVFLCSSLFFFVFLCFSLFFFASLVDSKDVSCPTPSGIAGSCCAGESAVVEVLNSAQVRAQVIHRDRDMRKPPN